MDAAYKRLEVTAGVDMDSWSMQLDSVLHRVWNDAFMRDFKADSVSMPVCGLGVSFDGNKPVDNTSLAKIEKVKYPARGGVKLSV